MAASTAMIVSEIDPTDHKSITTRHFPDEDFREADRESVKSERDNKLVEAEPSILKATLFFASWLVPGSRRYEGLFKRIWDYQSKIRHCDLLHRFMFHDNNSCRNTTFLSFIVLAARNKFSLSRKPSETEVYSSPQLASDGSDTLDAGQISVCSKASATEGLFSIRQEIGSSTEAYAL